MASKDPTTWLGPTGLEIRISDDIKAIIDWEIDNNGNAVDRVYYPKDLPVVLMKRSLKQRLEGKLREVPTTVSWWEFKSPHYPEDEWYAGFESAESGHKVCGPLG